MSKKEDLVSRIHRQTDAIAEHAVAQIRKTAATLVTRPWEGERMNRDEQMRAWERVRGDPQAVSDLVTKERVGVPWLAPERFPARLLKDMETAERRYQRWLAGQEDEV